MISIKLSTSDIQYRTGDALSVDLRVSSDYPTQDVVVTVKNYDTDAIVATLLNDEISFEAIDTFTAVVVPEWAVVGGKYYVEAIIGDVTATYGFIVDGGVGAGTDDISEAFYAYLSGIVSTDKLFAAIASDDAIYPFAVYTIPSDEREYTHEGESDTGTANISITVWGVGYAAMAQSRPLARLIKDSLKGYCGRWGVFDINPCKVGPLKEVTDFKTDSGEFKFAGVYMDLEVHYKVTGE